MSENNINKGIINAKAVALKIINKMILIIVKIILEINCSLCFGMPLKLRICTDEFMR
jgi:hypothetical protein